ncbi:MAG: cobalamin biosynthesis protein CbiD [Nitrospirae bacterium]|nr:cobalamin biosynthesis protein CbiD [Nitrospirota bacterium]
MTNKCGITTGTTAAGAAKAAAISLTGNLCPDTVSVTLPNGEDRNVLIERSANGQATAIKDAGDDPDVTNGLRITASIQFACRAVGASCSSNSLDNVIVKGGKGIGIVTKAGLQVPVGSHAINPVPTQMIKQAVRQILPHGGLIVEISVPEGERIAKKTFNERLGIIGGISIIGTTGIVTPMSLEAIKATIRCEIDVAAANQDIKILYLSPGKIGESALREKIGCLTVVQMSNYIGHALSYVKEKGIEEIVIGGHPGKLAKLTMGYWDTHSGNSPQAVNYVTEFIGIKNKKFNTVEEIIESLYNGGAERNFTDLAKEIAETIINKFGFKHVNVYLFDMKKRTIGESVCTRYI